MSSGSLVICVGKSAARILQRERTFGMRLEKLTYGICLGMAIAMFFGLAFVAQTRGETADLALSARLSGGNSERYIVRAHDSLYTIAKRFNTSIEALQTLNDLGQRRLLFAGDELIVPRLDETLFEAYLVQPGDYLFEIALRANTTVEALLALNGIVNRDHIVAGRTILLPQSASSSKPRLFARGITLFPDLQNTAELLRQVEALGVDWAKIEVRWADLQASENSFASDSLDALVVGLHALDVQILLNVYAAPDWARGAYTRRLNRLLRDNHGPPENMADFGSLMRALARRYAGMIDAYEIWKSPNILKYWTAPVYERSRKMSASGDYGLPDKIDIGAQQYVQMLQVAYQAIKSVDSDAQVITAGLAPVGFSDYYNSIETGEFLEAMLQAGAAQYSDGIGALFGASAVPPTFLCCQQPPGVDTHYESHLHYFREILTLYRAVLSRNGYGRLPVTVTQVGWGTIEGANLAQPAQGLEWLLYTDLREQARYAAQAFDIARAAPDIAGMFLYNLNGCAVGDSEACFFSLVDAQGSDRPIFEAFATMPSGS